MRRFAGALACALAAGGFLIAAAAPAAAGPNRAVVVIDTGGGSRRAVIEFSGTITGIQALQLAGANPGTRGYAGQGVAVCTLDGVGHAPDDSCLGTPSDPRYWAYFQAQDGAGGWTYSRGCACSSVVGDGDVEGWRFGTGQAPPFASFCAVAGCAPPPPPPPPPAPDPAPAAQGESASPGGAGPAAPGGAAPSSNAGSADSTTGTAPSGSADNPASSISPNTATDPSTPSETRRGSHVTNPTMTGNGDRERNEERALDATRRGGDDEGSGSPWGVIVAGGVAAGIGAFAIALRRRRSAA
jgi:hypothetical protein